MCRNVNQIYTIKDRGYIREGYFADIVLVNVKRSCKVTNNNILYQSTCLPFENQDRL